MLETTQRRMRITQYAPEVMEALLGYLYSRRLLGRAEMSPMTLFDLMRAASYFGRPCTPKLLLPRRSPPFLLPSACPHLRCRQLL